MFERSLIVCVPAGRSWGRWCRCSCAGTGAWAAATPSQAHHTIRQPQTPSHSGGVISHHLNRVETSGLQMPPCVSNGMRVQSWLVSEQLHDARVVASVLPWWHPCTSRASRHKGAGSRACRWRHPAAHRSLRRSPPRCSRTNATRLFGRTRRERWWEVSFNAEQQSGLYLRCT